MILAWIFMISMFSWIMLPTFWILNFLTFDHTLSFSATHYHSHFLGLVAVHNWPIISFTLCTTLLNPAYRSAFSFYMSLVTLYVWQAFEFYWHICECNLHYPGPTLLWALILSTQSPVQPLTRYWFPAAGAFIYFPHFLIEMQPFPLFSQNTSALIPILRCLPVFSHFW